MTQPRDVTRSENAARTAALKRRRRGERLGNAMLRVLAARCDELAKNAALPFDASGLTDDPGLPKQLQALAPISDKTWYRLKKRGEVSPQVIQFDLAGAASEIVRGRRLPGWIYSERAAAHDSDAFGDDPESPEPLSHRQIFEALALNGTVAEFFAPIEIDRQSWSAADARLRSFAIAEFGDIALGQSARLIEHAARTLVREEAPRSDQARLERLHIHRGWLGQLAQRAPTGDPDVLRDLTQAMSRVDGMIAGTDARHSVPSREPLPGPLYANDHGGAYSWDRGVIDMLVVRGMFTACREFACDGESPNEVRRSRVDYALERLVVFLIGSPTNSTATADARLVARALLEVSADLGEQVGGGLLTARARLQRIIDHYLDRDWVRVRATALSPATRYVEHEAQEGYNWPLQAALAREAAVELQGDNSGSDDIERYLSDYLRKLFESGAGALMDAALRDLAADSTPMPAPNELADTINTLMPTDTVRGLSDAVWALAIDRNFAGEEADRNERLRTVNYGGLALELWQAASTLAEVANRLRGLAAPFDYGPNDAKDFEDPARIKPILEALEQVWMKQPTTQLGALIKDLEPAFDPRTSRSPDMDLFDELQLRLGLIERKPRATPKRY